MDCTLYIYIYVYIYYNNKLQAHNYEIYTTHKYIYILSKYIQKYIRHTQKCTLLHICLEQPAYFTGYNYVPQAWSD